MSSLQYADSGVGSSVIADVGCMRGHHLIGAEPYGLSLYRAPNSRVLRSTVIDTPSLEMNAAVELPIEI
jgi:hypothetical protein